MPLFLIRFARPLAKLAAAGLLLLASLPHAALPHITTADEGGGRLQPPVHGVLTQVFGCTELELEPPAPGCAGGHFHAGIDLGAPEGTPVLAPASGAVAAVAFDAGGYGWFVDLAHPGGRATRHAHLKTALVVPGARVERGDPIGLLGSTGNSTGPHLHFEVRDHGRLVDPLALMAADSTDGGFKWLTR